MSSEDRTPRPDGAPTRGPRLGVLVGGSGLVGGTLLHHFKTEGSAGGRGRIDILAPNSKEMSVRSRRDVQAQFERV